MREPLQGGWKRCPVCGKPIEAPVRDTKIDYYGLTRYRRCEECGIIFVTTEKISHTTEWKGREAY